MKIGFVSLGCCKNLVDSEKIMGLLKNSGCEIVNNAKDADAIIINTCGFIDPSKEESINTILEMAEYKNGKCKKLIVTGCLAKRYKEQLERELPEVDVFIGNDEYQDLHLILSKYLGIKIIKAYGKGDRLMATKPWTGYLKIADGCDNCCTYCAIPLIRGRHISYAIEDLVKEAQEMAEKGVKELVVIAQDTTKYGTDKYGKRMLPELLERLVKISQFHWIRVLYTYPDEIDDELLSVMRKYEGKILAYFDIPMQHGDNEMLKLMNRRGSVESVVKMIDTIKATFKRPVFRTTMIVGFPYETEERFENMLNFVETVRWDRLGAFTYSHEEDTVAANYPDIDQEIKQERYDRLMELQTKIADENSKALIGETLEVLVEKYDGLRKCYYGRSIYSAPDGIDGNVIFKSNQELNFGDFVNVLITDAKDHDLYGHCE